MQHDFIVASQMLGDHKTLLSSMIEPLSHSTILVVSQVLSLHGKFTKVLSFGYLKSVLEFQSWFIGLKVNCKTNVKVMDS